MTGVPSQTRRAAIAGAAVVVAYVALAALSGHLSVLARRPLLEGSFAPQPYRFVNPPAAVRGTNQSPSGLTRAISLAPPERGAGVFGTGDLQAQLVLDPGSFPPSAGAGTVTLAITPLDPATVGAPPPGGYTIMGNAYRYRIAAKGGTEVPGFLPNVPAHLVLTYPTDSLYFKSVFATHTVVRLDAATWTPIPTADSPAAQQAASDVTALGTFAVAGKPAAPLAKGTPVGLIAGIAGAAVVALAAVVLLLRGRARRRRAASDRRRPKP